MWREIINRCKQENEEVIAKRKRSREESLVYTNGSDALKEATEYFVKLFDTFKLLDDRYVQTNTFHLWDIPHWNKVVYDNKKAEIASLEKSIEQILPPASLDQDEDEENLYSILMLTEEAIDQEIKNHQDEFERLKKIKQL